ncbi:MAG TPA: tRNA (adenosine(37)-N6)-threonylcarbamoyltransferase complex ATPase subunit type 1 TsaE [Candidatus Dormibacteraeota bacterium]|jgi:tRNA threonylcarbamoyladenosine biosynthesis protein TsaE|nr:tRNA (adenosine(37)-N6)-threonylcarbamoyltransferase complex ATPase subunit type 1 TsaE [Candidatus Dormibacteraeota bacterium]
MIVTNMDAETVVLTASPEQTEQLGRTLGAALRPGDVLALDGDLGAGKTVLVRGLAAGSGNDAQAVRSPTFVLHHVYRGAAVTLHHVDCYRLGRGADLDALDVDAMVEEGALAVEWAEYAPTLDALRPVHVRIDVGDGTQRRITLRDLPRHLAQALARA